ncbi:C-type lectin domain family 12 member A-like [Bufo bufo]|uniref:C-type lectin domain family 12 member A-like n=1 Tax=Bufo bufo TaxID=8384 RepID=UPI001ABE9D38|nr:C-type lectin domain family 12 member A-like [Bufo bufo]
MGEEITYADLSFHDSKHASTSHTVEKNPEVASFEHNAIPSRYQKKMYILIGLLVSILLLAVLAITISLFQAYEKQNYYRGRIQSISQTLANLRNDLCMRNEEEQKESCLLCPMNWVPIKKKCYSMSDEMLSWQESQRFCSAQNASLIMPKTSQEGDFISSMFWKSNKPPLWIGLSCSSNTNEKWLCLDNTTYVTSSYWSSQCRDMQCASSDFRSSNPSLFKSCSTPLKFICERLPVNLLALL